MRWRARLLPQAISLCRCGKSRFARLPSRFACIATTLARRPRPLRTALSSLRWHSALLQFSQATCCASAVRQFGLQWVAKSEKLFGRGSLLMSRIIADQQPLPYSRPDRLISPTSYCRYLPMLIGKSACQLTMPRMPSIRKASASSGERPSRIGTKTRARTSCRKLHIAVTWPMSESISLSTIQARKSAVRRSVDWSGFLLATPWAVS